MRAVRLIALIGIGAASSNGAARADGLPALLEFEWDVPAECGDRRVFESELEVQLDPEVATGLAAPLKVRIQVRSDAHAGWVLVVQTAGGARRVDDRNCVELLKAGAMFAALLIAPEWKRRGAESPGPGDSIQAYDPENPYGETPADPALEEPPAVVRDAPRRPHGAPIELVLRAAVGGEAILLPHPAPGVGLAAAMRRGWIRAEATATAWQTQPAINPDNPSQGVDVSLWVAGIRTCGEVARAGFGAALCVGGELERLRIAPFGLLSDEVANPPSRLAAVVAASVLRELGHGIYLRADFEATAGANARVILPFADGRPEEVLHSTGIFGGRALTGLEVRFR